MSGAGWATRQVAALQNVSTRMIEYVEEVQRKGIPELGAMVRDGKIKMHHAVPVARLPHSEQRRIVKGGPDRVKAAAKEIHREQARDRALALGEIALEVRVVGSLDEVAETLAEELGPLVARALASRILAVLAEDRAALRYFKSRNMGKGGVN